ncbi:MAG TPA: PTS sucrose transporter subunit IIBC [Ktedonobacteraceae bacterium]|nr:PTS sucrose transporter subunit IIBC [Ktedonobacteraceae bacterium]
MGNLAPALIIDPTSGIFVGALVGFILSLPISLFLAFWMSAVKRRWAVVLGAFIGAFIGFLIILGWVGTLIFNTPLPGADGASTFFGSLFFDSTLGLAGGMIMDLLIARANPNIYRRPDIVLHEE